jgi:hypothetical protein
MFAAETVVARVARATETRGKCILTSLVVCFV